MICAAVEDPVDVGGSLDTLAGSANPANAGTYTYVAPPGLMLSPSTAYYIVVTAGAAMANGSYEWGYMNTSSYDPVDSWGATVTSGSSNGSSWGRLGSNPNFDYSQFAIYATPVPEPSAVGLFALGGLLVGFQRWKARSVS
jgi:hypothetical protein